MMYQAKKERVRRDVTWRWLLLILCLGLCLCLCLITPAVSSQAVVINEMMSANSGFLLDEDGDDSDWIELYNPGNQPINLQGYYLSDKLDNLTRWAFPDTTLAAGEYMLIFASGKDRSVPGQELHTNFSINSDGEDLVITHQGMIVCHMPAVSLTVNTSYGMYPDGEYPFVVFSHPTPGASNNGGGVAATVTFSTTGGIFQNPFEISLGSSLPDTRIFYTTNGNTPDPLTAHLYQQPLFLDQNLFTDSNINQIQVTTDERHNPPNPEDVLKAVTLRAAAFDNQNRMVSAVETNTYFIETLGNNHHGLPVLSICTEHDGLFNYYNGIYVTGVHWDPNEPDWSGNFLQRGRDWERVASLEFYPPDNKGFKQTVGLRVHGQGSRRLPQKPLRLYARSDYGESYFNYPFFGDEGLEKYKRFVIKPFSASWSPAGFEDYLSNALATKLKCDDIVSTPVILYLNGEYWGIYFLHERIDERLMVAKFDAVPDSIDMIENWSIYPMLGSSTDFIALYDFIENNDLTIPHNYNHVIEQIDVDNYIDYLIFQNYIGNYDWPANNMRCWKHQKEGSKWRWIFVDGDAGFQNVNFDAFRHNSNTGEDHWSNDPKATLFFRKLMKNESFKKRFFNRMEYLLNHHLNYQTGSYYLNKVVNQIYHDIPNQMLRFGIPETFGEWSEQVMSIRDFLKQRMCVLAEHAKERYSVQMALPSCDGDEVKISNLLVYPNPHRGQFGLSLTSTEASKATVIITNVIGQQLFHKEAMLMEGLNNFRIDEPSLPEGVLILTVITGNTVASCKMLCFREP